MRIKKQRKVTVAASQRGQVGQMQAKAGKEVLVVKESLNRWILKVPVFQVRTDHQKEERMPSIT